MFQIEEKEKEIMFCASCGKQVAEGTSFCPNCGVRLSAPTPPAATYTPPTAEPLPPTPAAAPPKSKKKMWIAIVAVALVASAVMGYFISSGRNDGKENGKTGTNAAERVDGKVDARGDEKTDGNRNADSDVPSVRSVAGTYVANVDAIALFAQMNEFSTTASCYVKMFYQFDGNGNMVGYFEFDASELVQAMIQCTADKFGISFEEAKQALYREYDGDMEKYVFDNISTKDDPLIATYTVKGNTLEIVEPNGAAESQYLEIVGDTLRAYSEEYDISIVLKRQ